jgi:hypothetical protein
MTTIRFRDVSEAASQDSTWSNAAKLSRKVRELAGRSYRALKAGPRREAPAPTGPQDRGEDLRDLRAQVARLQQKIHERRFQTLIPWVDALRRKVDDRLATREKTDHDEGADS